LNIFPVKLQKMFDFESVNVLNPPDSPFGIEESLFYGKQTPKGDEP